MRALQLWSFKILTFKIFDKFQNEERLHIVTFKNLISLMLLQNYFFIILNNFINKILIEEVALIPL